MRRRRNGATTGIVKRPLFAAAFFVLFFAPFSFSAGWQATSARPAKSMTVQIITRAPQPDKWEMTNSLAGATRTFTCKPHACLSPVKVSFSFRKGTLKPPRAEALKKFATVELPKLVRAAAVARTVMTGIVERIETLSSTTAILKNYPAALNETEFFRQGIPSAYLETGVIFAGPVVIRIESSSPNRNLARKSLFEFVAAMQIVVKTAPPLPAPGVPHVPKSESL